MIMAGPCANMSAIHQGIYGDDINRGRTMSYIHNGETANDTERRRELVGGIPTPLKM